MSVIDLKYSIVFFYQGSKFPMLLLNSQEQVTWIIVLAS